MVRFAVSSMFFNEYPVDQIFDYAEEAGCSGIEFWVETPHFWLRGLPLDEIRACIREHAALAPLTLHAPVLDLNPCSINPDIAEISQDWAVRAVGIAAALGAETVTLHPGRRTAKRVPSATDFERFEHYTDRIRETAGTAKVRIAIENMEPKINSLLCTPEDVHELLLREPWLWFTLDIAHAMAGPEEDVGAYIACCHGRLANVHVSAVADGRMHLPVAGNPRVEGILEILRDTGYDQNLTLELEDLNFGHDLSSEEKVAVLFREIEWLRRIFE
jgi:sugar phosphate isomerase/epimerase